MAELTKDLIRKKEGFSPTAYWDVTAWRVGYGSDTVTDADGTVRRVTKDTITTKPDAERDLDRRVPQFQQTGVIAYVGQDAWDALTPAAQASVTSVAYNYGSLRNLRSLQRAIKAGDPEKVALAIEARGTDNGGVNKGRRFSEAKLIRDNPAPAPTSPAIPARRPTTVDGKQVSPMGSPDISLKAGEGGSTVLTSRPVKTKDYIVDPNTGAVTKAPVQGLKLPVAPAAKPAPVKSSVPSLGKSVQQIGQEADNGRLSGYREIQAMGPKTGAVAPKAATKPAPRPSGVTRVNTEYVRPDGTSKPSQSAGEGAVMPARKSTVLTGGMSPTERDEAAAAKKAGPLPAPAPLTFTKPVYKTVTVLNPAWQAVPGKGMAASGAFNVTEAQRDAFAGTGDATTKLPAAVQGPPGVKQYIQKRVLVTPARPIAAPVKPVAKAPVKQPAPAPTVPKSYMAAPGQNMPTMAPGGKARRRSGDTGAASPFGSGGSLTGR